VAEREREIDRDCITAECFK